MDTQTTYIGIDPGVAGSLVALSSFGQSSIISVIGIQPCDASEADIWQWLCGFIGIQCRAVIEQQTPRPTWVSTLNRSTILASTCILYGSYCQLRAMLTCAAIPFDQCPPKRWQSAIGMSGRIKGEKERGWKNRLKTRAQQLFPKVKVTLADADALLIAEYCRRVYGGSNSTALSVASTL